MSQPFFPGQQNQPPNQPYPPVTQGPYGQPQTPYGQPQGPYGPAGYSPNPSPVYAPSPYPQPSPTNGYAGAALLIGIISVLLVFAPVIGIVGFIGGVAAIILGAIGVRRNTAKGISIAGIILGALTVLIGVIALIITGMAIRGATAEVTVEYSATVSVGSANVTYTNPVYHSQDITGSWSSGTQSVRKADGSVSFSVSGNDFDQIQTVTCQISVNGKVVSSDSGTLVAFCDASLT